MIYGIINAIISSFAGVIYKKSLELTDGFLSHKLYQFVSSIITLGLGIFGYFFLDFSIIGGGIAGLLFLSAILGILSEGFAQYAYKNEKLSTLLPYGEFETIFTVICGFFLFSNGSVNALFFTLLAAVILIIGSINFKKISFNKYCGGLICSALLASVQVIIYGYILLEVSAYNTFMYNTLMIFGVLFVINLFTRDLSGIKKLSSKTTGFLVLENILRFMHGVISLFLIQELGIISAVLIGMLTMVFSMITAFIFLGERPGKKEILIAVFVSICIGLGIFLQ